MNVLRKLGVVVFVVLFSLSLIFLVLTNSLVRTVGSPNTVKSWLRDGDLYSAVNQTIKTQGETLNTQNGPVVTSQPAIQNILGAALSTKFLQTSGEKIIDGMYVWLNGDVKKPNIVIDISGPKQIFAQKIGEYAKSRYLSLPDCPYRTLPNTSSALDINCKVAGYNIDPIIQQFVSSIQTSPDFFPSNTISADNLNELQSQDKNSDKTSTKSDKNEGVNFDNLTKIPTNYQRFKLASTLLFLVLLITGALAVVLSSSKKQGLKRIARSMLSIGIIYLIVGSVIIWLSGKIELFKVKTVDMQKLQESITKISILVIKSIGHVILFFAISYVVIGLGTIITLRVLNKKDSKTKNHPKDDTDNTTTDTEEVTENKKVDLENTKTKS